MADAEDKVMKYVERELAKNPDVTNETLFEGARKIDRSVGKLTRRQFHAKYPLQVKRRKGKGKSAKSSATKTRRKKRSTASRRSTGRQRTRTATAGGTDNAEGVRRVLMRFAGDLSKAESQSETIDVLSRLDRYVSDIMKVTGS